MNVDIHDNLSDFEALPPELLLKIFKLLELDDVARCAMVCRIFNEISKEPHLYKNVKIDRKKSGDFVEWVLCKATCPRKMTMYDWIGASDLIAVHVYKWKALEELSLRNANLCKIKALPIESLTVLKLEFCCINHNVLDKFLRQNRKLRVLSLLDIECLCDQCYDSFDEQALISLEPLTQCSQLEIVRILAPEKALKGLAHLSDCPNLKELSLNQMGWKCSRTSDNVAALQEIASKCSRLERIRFCGMEYVNDGMLASFFSECRSLRQIEFLRLHSITKRGCLAAIETLPKLTNMVVSFCRQLGEKDKKNVHLAVKKIGRNVDFVFTSYYDM